MIGQLILVVMAWREMLGENLTAHLDGLNEAVGVGTAREMAGQLGDHVLPHRGLNLAVDALVGDDLDVALSEGDVNEHAGAALGGRDRRADQPSRARYP